MTILNKPTIYNAPTIYKLGGGGGENPDGSIKCLGIMNCDSSHFLSIGGLTLTRLFTYEFDFLSGSGGGMFGAVWNGSGAYYNRTVSGMRDNGMFIIGGGSYGSSEYSVSGVSAGAKCKSITKQSNNNYTFEIYKNGVLVGTNTAAITWNVVSATFLQIFKSWDNSEANCGKFTFLGLKIIDPSNDTIKYNFTPAEKEGVAGVYEEITGIFYGETYHDNSIVALK